MISSILPTYARANLTFVKGEGSWLIERDGRRFLDFGAGVAVNALGHAHPKLVEALTAQAQTLWHTSNLYHIPKQQDLADLLIKHSFADTCFITNSGTESCELAVKMARKYWADKGYPTRTDILTLEGAFHGRSSAGIAASSSDKMREGFAPILPGFTHIAFNDIDAVQNAITPHTAAIMIEPIQGEGGIRPLSLTYLQELRALCDKTQTLLICDEIQCGVARTGKLFAHEWAHISPDIMMIAKGIGGGFPIGAVLATQDAASAMTLGTHGSTYGGNPLGCAVACALLEHVTQKDFMQSLHSKSQLLAQGLQDLCTAFPQVFKAWRGQGLMLGLICNVPNSDVIAQSYAHNLLLVPAARNTVRLLPPLNITNEDLNIGLSKLRDLAQQLTLQASS